MQMRRPTFFERYSLYILMGIFFLVPFALRGARLALEQMRNDVKDWLPDEFAETSELDWFRDHVLGEQFVLISWDGCTAEDQRLDLLARLLVPPPPTEDEVGNEPIDHRMPDFFGDKLGLITQAIRPKAGADKKKSGCRGTTRSGTTSLKMARSTSGMAKAP